MHIEKKGIAIFHIDYFVLYHIIHIRLNYNIDSFTEWPKEKLASILPSSPIACVFWEGASRADKFVSVELYSEPSNSTYNHHNFAWKQ